MGGLLRLRKSFNRASNGNTPISHWFFFELERGWHSSRRHGNRHVHVQKSIGRAVEIAGYGRALCDVAADCDRNEVSPPDATVGRIEGDPSCTWYEHFCPSMGRPGVCRSEQIPVRVVEIARDEPGAEAKLSRGFDEQYRKVPA